MKDIGYYSSLTGIELTAVQLDMFAVYKDILLEYNSKMNLTRITGSEEIELKHFTDSVIILPMLKASMETNSGILKIADVGTGAGFPGIPLKIAEPSFDLTLIDSLRKRVEFLDAVITRLALGNTKAMHLRAEDAGRDKALRESFDIVTARAVAPLDELCEYCLPLVRQGGIFAAMKTGLNDELEQAGFAMKTLGGSLEQVSEYYLPETDIFRSLVIIRKTVPTPGRYPRKAGKPSSDPLRGGK